MGDPCFSMKHGDALAVAVLAAAFASAAPARGDDSKDCIAASTQAQQLRDDGHYRRARDQFNVCSRDVCPALVKQACLGWMSDLESTWPSVVVNAKDDNGADLVDVTVVIDGTPLVSKLDGKPQLVDPGEHDLHYETGGFPPVNEHVVIHAGEKSRVLSVQFGEGKKPTRRKDGGTGGGGGGGGGGSETPVAGWVFGGLALVSFGVEAAVGIPAFNDRNNLENSPCKATSSCDQAQVDSIHTRFIVSDVLGAVGLVSAGVAIYFFATAGSSHETPKAARVDVRPLPGGGALAGWSGSF
jgi:hypothetical protein